jgi:GNAT superfamily N-acetyltransferase
MEVEISEARSNDASRLADIHLEARREAMPFLNQPFTDDETREWFTGAVGDPSGNWWIARQGSGPIAGYMSIYGDEIDHLYVMPGYQRRGIGRALLNKAKELSPHRLALFTFQKNANARAFYEANGFRAVAFTDGENVEGEPDVQYEWTPT